MSSNTNDIPTLPPPNTNYNQQSYPNYQANPVQPDSEILHEQPQYYSTNPSYEQSQISAPIIPNEDQPLNSNNSYYQQQPQYYQQQPQYYQQSNGLPPYNPNGVSAQPVYVQQASVGDDTVEKNYLNMTLIFLILGFCIWCFWIVSFTYSRKSTRKQTRMLGNISFALIIFEIVFIIVFFSTGMIW